MKGCKDCARCIEIIELDTADEEKKFDVRCKASRELIGPLTDPQVEACCDDYLPWGSE